MNAFWSGTPYFDFYFYMGGTNGRSYCGPGGVNASGVDQVTNIGYSVLPIWVGRSGNCGTSSTRVRERQACAPAATSDDCRSGPTPERECQRTCVPARVDESRQLNCSPGLLGPGQSRAYEMRIDVPGDVPTGVRAKLTWRMSVNGEETVAGGVLVLSQ
jgi:hypothetical protein